MFESISLLLLNCYSQYLDGTLWCHGPVEICDMSIYILQGEICS